MKRRAGFVFLKSSEETTYWQGRTNRKKEVKFEKVCMAEFSHYIIENCHEADITACVSRTSAAEF